MDDQISAKEFGEMSANVRHLLNEFRDMKTNYALKAEVEPRLQALEQDKHRVWDKIVAFGSIVSAVVAVIALIRTIK